MTTLDSGWEMIASSQDQLTRQEIFSRTYDTLVSRVEQELDEPGLFTTQGGESQISPIIRASMRPEAFITGNEDTAYTFNADVQATPDVHAVTTAMKRVLDVNPIIPADRQKLIYDARYMLPHMSNEQIRYFLTHGLSPEQYQALNKVIELTRKIISNSNNKVTLDDISKRLGSHLFMPLDYYSIETSLAYREMDVKKGRDLSKDELQTGEQEMNARININRKLFDALLNSQA